MPRGRFSTKGPFKGFSRGRYALVIHDGMAFIESELTGDFLASDDFLNIVAQLNRTAEQVREGKSQVEAAFSGAEKTIQEILRYSHISIPGLRIPRRSKTGIRIPRSISGAENCVYFIAAPDHAQRADWIKIGSTSKMGTRISQLKAELKSEIVVHALIQAPNYKQLERALHVYFSECRADFRGDVEWFECGPVLAFVEELAAF